ncbi:DUF1080 domain-containing protein [Sphingomonas piscis]|uniref:DUF1080 domain-containing protein n=1 Tax=Sphingomonas piscis TaxID=2714943 RepID=A0A6G7YNT2_9SPHN|nr:DUF1080 domain-containing protein [Sphingomonas piscis]QIK78403.1 DUF1080 domain-containing protein [Sphingomonas piscis]
MKMLMITATLAVAMPAGVDAAGWQRIFDGKTLKGWTPKVTGARAGVNWGNSFKVRNGAIRVDYAGWKRFDKRFGHLAYKRPVGPFRLRFQYRFFGKTLPGTEAWQGSNSGAMLLAQSPWSMSRNQEFPVSLEMQLLGADRADKQPTGNLCTPGTNVVIGGKLETQHCLLSSSPLMANGRWINVEAEMTREGRVTHWINGKTVFQFSDPQYDPTDKDAKPLIRAAGGKLRIRKGYIYLQSEGHPVEFRNIELMELKWLQPRRAPRVAASELAGDFHDRPADRDVERRAHHAAGRPGRIPRPAGGSANPGRDGHPARLPSHRHGDLLPERERCRRSGAGV